jgi:hypothetical protein
LTGAREKLCGRALSPSKNWQTSVRRFGRSSDNKSTYEKRPSQSLLVHCSQLQFRFSMSGKICKILASTGSICKTIAACSQYDNVEPVASEIKLKGHAAVPGDEHLKANFFGFL